MSQRLIEAQENERSWIALELHEDINQRLAAVRLQLSLLGKVFRHLWMAPGKTHRSGETYCRLISDFRHFRTVSTRQA